jgi:hypothetical protein
LRPSAQHIASRDDINMAKPPLAAAGQNRRRRGGKKTKEARISDPGLF